MAHVPTATRPHHSPPLAAIVVTTLCFSAVFAGVVIISSFWNALLILGFSIVGGALLSLPAFFALRGETKAGTYWKAFTAELETNDNVTRIDLHQHRAVYTVNGDPAQVIVAHHTGAAVEIHSTSPAGDDLVMAAGMVALTRAPRPKHLELDLTV